MTTPNWTLSVENFGCVRRAEITLAPLVVMVGRNNTGKSYLASLIWGVLNPHKVVFPPKPIDGVAYNACRSLFERLRCEGSIVIGVPEWEILLNWINELLRDRSQEIANSILGCSGASLGAMSVTCGSWPDDLTVKMVAQETRGLRSHRSWGEGINNLTFYDNGDSINKWPTDYDFIKYLALSLTFDDISLGGGLYIPAARTGLMITYRALIAGLFRTLAFEGGDEFRMILPRPIVDFLAMLNGVIGFSYKNILFEIASDLEQEVLQGEIKTPDDDRNEFWYVPQGSNIKLPMCAVSSLVTELAPFIMILKSGLLSKSLIFEEPEAHLHLSAQKVLARSLVRLVNAGVQVIVTTHSDTFLQQLNILMHLHQHPRRDELIEEFGYRPDETLNPESARGYLFAETGDGTVVQEMKKHREGFVEPLMNEAIANMTKEVLRLQETDDLSADEP